MIEEDQSIASELDGRSSAIGYEVPSMIGSTIRENASEEISPADTALIDSLKESAYRYSSFFKSSPDGFVLTDEKGTIIEWNQRTEQLTGLRTSEVIGKPLWSIYTDIALRDDGEGNAIMPEVGREIEELFNKGRDSPPARSSEIILSGKNKNIRIILFPIKSEKGLMYGVHAREKASCKQEVTNTSKPRVDLNFMEEENITCPEKARTADEVSTKTQFKRHGSKPQNLRKAIPGGMPIESLNDKAMRNLQKLSDLPGLPPIDADEGIEDELELGRNRIRSIALAYDLLSKSPLLDRISIAVYISSLVERITKSSEDASNRVSFILDVDVVMLRPESVVSCGLIINEIISNSLRYARTNDGKWVIRIEFRSMGASIYRLAISDNGKEIGLDDEGAPLRSALNSLIKEIEGRIKIDVSNGNKAEIYFNELKYDSRLNTAQDRRYRT